MAHPIGKERLGKIRVPTLIIGGQFETSTPLDRSKKTQGRIPDSRFVIIPDVGHMTPVEVAEAINDALLEFLATLS